MSTPNDPTNPGPQGDPGGGWNTPPGQQGSDQPPGNQQWGDQNPGNQQWGGNQPQGNQQWGDQSSPGQGYGGQYSGGQHSGAKPSNGMGLTAMIIGIVSLLIPFVGALGGIVAIILGVLGRKKVKRGEADNGGQALAGIITGALALLFWTIAFVLVVVVGSTVAECVDPNLTQPEIDRCVEDQLTNQ